MSNPVENPSRFIAFFDECGDHSLEVIDKDFPLFVLSTVIVERSDYVNEIIPKLGKMKMRFWNHEGINLHSRDIRKAIGDFAFMQIPDKRVALLEAVSEMMTGLPFTLFITAIRKDMHKKRYGALANNPYEVALTYTFERVLHFLENNGEAVLPVVAEARGKNEDNQLEAAFHRLLTNGTNFIPAEKFRKLRCPISFRKKTDNIAGLQIADLCAYPAARNILNPTKQNPAYEVVARHIYQFNGVRGLKVFP